VCQQFAQLGGAVIPNVRLAQSVEQGLELCFRWDDDLGTVFLAARNHLRGIF
jgi:hypothetical protein